MDRGFVRPDEAFVGHRIGRARWHGNGRWGNARCDFRFRSAQGLEWLRPCHFGARASCATGTRFAAPTRTAGTTRLDHHDPLNHFRPGSTRRLSRAPATTSPTLTAAVAPSASRDVSSAGGSADAMEPTRRGTHRKGHVDLAVGQH
jgi:hypothetical protein